MRAKFINEIKQNVNKSGLGVIDIGKEDVLKEYRYIKKNFSCIITHADELDIIDELPDEIKARVAEHLACKESDIMGISDLNLVSSSLDQDCVAGFIGWTIAMKDKSFNKIDETLYIENEKYFIHGYDYNCNLIRVNTYDINSGPNSNQNLSKSYTFFRI